jgi:DNA invertase Pin-like site-specific DNA recombinase
MGDTIRGRPRALDETAAKEAEKLYFDEGMPVRDIADAMHVSHMTIWRAICRQQEENG